MKFLASAQVKLHYPSRGYSWRFEEFATFDEAIAWIKKTSQRNGGIIERLERKLPSDNWKVVERFNLSYIPEVNHVDENTNART